MKFDDKLEVLGSFFSLTDKERASFLSGINKATALTYGDDGSTTDNVLYFLCVNYLDTIVARSNSEDVGGETFYRELMALLNVFLYLPAQSGYVWDYSKHSKESYITGVFDDLWFVVARLSRVMLAHHGWEPKAPPVDVNQLVNELLA